jgi:hypothetical protein
MLYLRRTGFPKGALSPFPHSPPEIAGPQSNQRGIETRDRRQHVLGRPWHLNRTSLGLKRLYTPDTILSSLTGLNRTGVGLKHDDVVTLKITFKGPQSNQRGIETLGPPRRRAGRDRWPQSNQRGIETQQAWNILTSAARPQSNQRGIETQHRRRWPLASRDGLNLTSVGLKLTCLPRWLRERPTCLNRTSVGLKLGEGGSQRCTCSRPQSNQRGIETRCWCSFLSEEMRDGTLCKVSKLREHG